MRRKSEDGFPPRQPHGQRCRGNGPPSSNRCWNPAVVSTVGWMPKPESPYRRGGTGEGNNQPQSRLGCGLRARWAVRIDYSDRRSMLFGGHFRWTVKGTRYSLRRISSYRKDLTRLCPKPHVRLLQDYLPGARTSWSTTTTTGRNLRRAHPRSLQRLSTTGCPRPLDGGTSWQNSLRTTGPDRAVPFGDGLMAPVRI